MQCNAAIECNAKLNFVTKNKPKQSKFKEKTKKIALNSQEYKPKHAKL
jgi:hypothetical protein